MAILKTRVKQKIATLTTWKTAWESFKPLDGEIIKIKITNNSEAADTPLGSNSGITFPIVLSKTGDGTSTLKALAWDYAVPTNVFTHNHNSEYLPINTNYALSSTPGGSSLSSAVRRANQSIFTIAASLDVDTETVWFGGSNGVSDAEMPENYCICNIKRGNNHRTLIDCYSLVNGKHWINGCISTLNGDPWTGWKLQPGADHLNDTVAHITANERTIWNSKADGTHSHTIAAGAVDGIFDITGISGTDSVTYQIDPYTTKQSGKFYTGTTDPTANNRLNYGGNFHATKLYSGGTEVELKGHTHDYSSSNHTHASLVLDDGGSYFAFNLQSSGGMEAVISLDNYDGENVSLTFTELKKLKQFLTTIELIEE